MRKDIRLLQEILQAYLKVHGLSQDKFVEKANKPDFNRGRFNYVLAGKATTVDIAVLDACASAMDMPLVVLLGKIGILPAREAYVYSTIEAKGGDYIENLEEATSTSLPTL